MYICNKKKTSSFFQLWNTYIIQMDSKLSYVLQFHMLSLENYLENRIIRKLYITLKNNLGKFHLGPESSMAWINKEESLVRSENRSDKDNSCGLHLLVLSALWEASHFSARPSPSSMRTTSDIFGLWLGRYCVHKSATWTISSSSILS